MAFMKERLLGRRKDIITYLVLAVIGAAFFCAIYGYRVLKPWYTDWMYNDGDIEQHFMGWLGYRAGSWTFPVGNSDVLSYPGTYSIVYTDSIPLFAVLFKLLSPFLPETFQYFGLWGLMCFVLQAWFGGAITGRFTESRISMILGGTAFLLTPVFIQRMFVHTALAGHFVILMALYLFVSYEHNHTKKTPYIWAGVTGFLCAGMHVYLLLMCGIIVASYALLDLLKKKRIMRPVLVVLCYISSALLNLFILGALTSSNGSSSTGGLGEFGFNLNSFFNPLYHSSLFFGELSIYNRNAENYAYLGLGVILMVIFAAVTTVISFFGRKKGSGHKAEIASVLVLFFLTVIIASSPVITCADHKLFEYPVPGFIDKVWSIFRSSGRIIWVDIYLLVIWGIWAVSKYVPRKAAPLILCAVIAVQAADISPLMRDKYEEFFPIVYKVNIMDNDIWREVLSDPSVKHIYVTYECEPYSVHRFAFADMALSSGRTMNQFLIARNEFTSEGLAADMFPIRDDTVYIFTDQTIYLALGTDLKIIETGDGFRLGYSGGSDIFDRLEVDCDTIEAQ